MQLIFFPLISICKFIFSLIENLIVSFCIFKIYYAPLFCFVNDVHRFLTIFDPPSPPDVRFLPSNVRFFWVILDPPSPPKIGHHLCTFPYDSLIVFGAFFAPLTFISSPYKSMDSDKLKMLKVNNLE